MMNKYLIKVFLSILNCRFLNQSPCKYGYIGNVDAFSYANLASEEKQRPGITVKTILEEADMFRSCPIGKGLQVIENGEIRDGTIWDVHDLRQQLTRDV